MGGDAVVSLHYTVAWRFEWVWIDHFSCCTSFSCESIATPAKETKHLGTAINCMLLYPRFWGPYQHSSASTARERLAGSKLQYVVTLKLQLLLTAQ